MKNILLCLDTLISFTIKFKDWNEVTAVNPGEDYPKKSSLYSIRSFARFTRFPNMVLVILRKGLELCLHGFIDIQKSPKILPLSSEVLSFNLRNRKKSVESRLVCFRTLRITKNCVTKVDMREPAPVFSHLWSHAMNALQ